MGCCRDVSDDLFPVESSEDIRVLKSMIQRHLKFTGAQPETIPFLPWFRCCGTSLAMFLLLWGVGFSPFSVAVLLGVVHTSLGWLPYASFVGWLFVGATRHQCDASLNTPHH